MSKYQLNYEHCGDIKLYDIPEGDQEFLDHVDSVISSAEIHFRTLSFLVMNHMAYSRLCTACSDKSGTKNLITPTMYKGLAIVVVPVPGHENNKYTSHVFGAFPTPDRRDLFKILNQEQFNKKDT